MRLVRGDDAKRNPNGPQPARSLYGDGLASIVVTVGGHRAGDRRTGRAGLPARTSPTEPVVACSDHRTFGGRAAEGPRAV